MAGSHRTETFNTIVSAKFSIRLAGWWCSWTRKQKRNKISPHSNWTAGGDRIDDGFNSPKTELKGAS